MPKKRYLIDEYYSLAPGNELAERAVAALLAEYANDDDEPLDENRHELFGWNNMLDAGAILPFGQLLARSEPLPDPILLLEKCGGGWAMPHVTMMLCGEKRSSFVTALSGASPCLLDGEWTSWLLGNQVWELSREEQRCSREQQRLLIMEATDRDRQKFERLSRKFSGVPAGDRRRQAIPESVRILVWRRDGGKCVECGSQERLEYDHIIPFSRVVAIPTETFSFCAKSVIARRETRFETESRNAHFCDLARAIRSDTDRSR